jgi:hypothetical protein
MPYIVITKRPAREKNQVAGKTRCVLGYEMLPESVSRRACRHAGRGRATGVLVEVLMHAPWDGDANRPRVRRHGRPAPGRHGHRGGDIVVGSTSRLRPVRYRPLRPLPVVEASQGDAEAAATIIAAFNAREAA